SRGCKNSEQLDHLPDDDRCKPLGWLIHHQQGWTQQECPGDREHLLLASRQLGSTVVPTLDQARKRVVDSLEIPVPGSLGARSSRKQQVLFDSERRPKAPALGDI